MKSPELTPGPSRSRATGTPSAGPEGAPASVVISIRHLTVRFGAMTAVKDLTLDIPRHEVFGIIGPAQSGKTTLLRTLNRLDETLPGLSLEGEIWFNRDNIIAPGADVSLLRRSVGMVFATPVPLPGSIFDNVALGLKFRGATDRAAVAAKVEESLTAAFLWDEVKDRLGAPAATLSGGQSQRLCLARSLALDPEVLLLDEPCSALDPVSTAKIEEALTRLKTRRTIVLVTNIVAQAARTSDRTAMMLMGELVECDATAKIFTNPRDRRTEDYITGRYG